ncbi:hypothetical protein PUN28_000027 [Cardiocondyla obscurior]|uniref:Uncharacterized protein n=1 Tax=Cardiocondyla obscurior TaxID=286306 RepID=A0AAW2GXD6_9HYME
MESRWHRFLKLLTLRDFSIAWNISVTLSSPFFNSSNDTGRKKNRYNIRRKMKCYIVLNNIRESI